MVSEVQNFMATRAWAEKDAAKVSGTTIYIMVA